jgi:gliding motility-associated-like protein
MENVYPLKKLKKKQHLNRFLKWFGICCLIFIAQNKLSSCDTSGFFIDDVVLNPDGTYTVTLTIEVGGFPTTGVGSTWGFYFNANNPILAVNPPSLTSQNGTQIFAVITGTTITWGDPIPNANPPFVDMNVDPTQQFTVTLIVGSINGDWDGGGQEGNNCPGGPGTMPADYGGPWPCPLPEAPLVIVPPKVCPNEIINLTAIGVSPTNTITWNPPGLNGPSVNVSFPGTTTIDVTVENECGSQTTVPVLIEILPLPDISAINPTEEICEGAVAYLEVGYSNECGTPPLPTWSNGGIGSFNIVNPMTSPEVYTASVTNPCGVATADFTVTTVAIPMIDILTDNDSICLGEDIDLEADANTEVFWNPIGEIGDIINVSPTETTTYIATVTNICGTIADEVTITVNEDVEAEVNLEACANSFVLFDGQPLDPGTVTEFTFAAFNGCDSLITVTVDELPTYSNDVELEACTGTSVLYNGFELFPNTFTEITLTALNTCDSVIAVTVVELQNYDEQLEIPTCEGSFANYNGNQLPPNSSNQFMFVASNGCDSLVTVFVPELQVYEEDLELETCTGTTVEYNGLQLQPGTTSAFTFSSLNGCDSVVNVSVIELQDIESDQLFQTCPGTTVMYNGQELDPGTETEFMFVTATGCDSTVIVTVEELPAFTNEVELEACTGTTVMYNGQELDPGTQTEFMLTAANSCDSVVSVMVMELSNFRDTLNLGTCSGTTISYNGQELDPGTTTEFIFGAVNTCDSVVTVVVEELSILSSDLELQTCPNTTIEYNGEDYAVGVETDVFFTASNGCDSMVHLMIVALPEFSEDLQLQACTGSNATYNGQSLAPGTTTQFTFPALNGCDSTVSVFVEELDAFSSDLEIPTCPGQSVDYNGQTLMPGTMTDVTFISGGGCDSIVTVAVVELNVFSTPIDLETCSGSTVMYNGQELMPNTTTDFVFGDQNGCDSTVTVTVMELPTFDEMDEFDACIGTSIMYNGMELMAGTVTEVMFMTQNGCDSVVTVTVNEVNDFQGTEQLATCVGSTIEYNGQNLPAGITTQFVFQAQNGCDSVVTVTVEELDAFTSDLTLETCPNGSVIYDGQELFPGDQVPFTLTAQNGCDSVVIVLIEALPDYQTPVQLQACSGETVDYNGQNLLAGTTTDVLFAAVNGCDSLVTVFVEELEIFASPLNLQACIGSSIVYNGQTLQAGTVTDIQLVAENGCDSIVTVAVDELPFLTSSLDLQECQGVDVVYDGTVITPGTSMDFTYTGSTGCDSIVTVNALTPLPPSQTTDEVTICTGETIVLFGQTVSTPGEYSSTFSNQDGCDSVHTITLLIQEEMDLSVTTENSCQEEDTGFAEIMVSGSEGPYSYSWNASPIDNSVIENLPAGNYSVTVTDGMNCTNTTDVSIGNFSLAYDATGSLNCFGDTDGIISVEAQGNNILYSLDGQNYSDNPLFTNLSAGQYDVFVQDEHDCVYPTSVDLVNPPEVIVAFQEDEITIDLGESITLNPIIVVSGNSTINWTDDPTLSCLDCENPIATPTDNDIYQVTIIDENGCVATDDILIRVNKNRDLYIPNAFSPNGDGINDNFTVYGEEKNIVKVHRFQIFSRWGEPVFVAQEDFQINNGNDGWNGKYRGEDLNAAVFVYFVEVEFLDGTIELFKGDLTLTR